MFGFKLLIFSFPFLRFNFVVLCSKIYNNQGSMQQNKFENMHKNYLDHFGSSLQFVSILLIDT